MKNQWIVYVIVVLLSIGAGVAIAGLPDNSSSGSGPIVSVTSTAPSTTAPVFEPSPTDPPTDTTDDPSTQTTAEAVVDTTADPSTTVVTTTDPATTVITTTDPATTAATSLPPRDAVVVLVANGTGRQGVAADTVTLINGTGWTNARATTGLSTADVTRVYYVDGFDASAADLAASIGVDPTQIAPLPLAPAVEDLGIAQLLLYVGTDRV